MIKKKILDCPIELKALSNNGYFSGYASIFNYVDNHQDVIMEGAFERTLDMNNGGKDIKLLWQHDSTEPIGYFTKIEEDEYGLHVEGQLMQEVEKGREAYSMLKTGAIKGLSIGFKVKGYEIDFNSGTRVITDLDLYEISLVTFPANDLAQVMQVKHTAGYAHSKLDKKVLDFNIAPTQMIDLSDAIDSAVVALRSY